MAVLSVTTLTVKPDRYEAFLETQRKWKAVLERCGAENVRVIGTIVAGEASVTVAMTWEAKDNATWGSVLDEFLGDPDGMALLLESGSESGPWPRTRARCGATSSSDPRGGSATEGRIAAAVRPSSISEQGLESGLPIRTA